MTIKEIIQDANALLKQNGFDINQGDAEILLAHILGKTREYLHTYPEQQITPEQQDLFWEYIHKRLKYVPIAYLTGKKHFFGLEFIVNKDVLIPRPETEILVQESLKVINNFPHLANVADIGTGSGCIAISILKHSNNIFRMYATDISRKALKIAKINAQRYEEEFIRGRIVFLKGSLLKPLGIIPIEILISNLPYLSWDEYSQNPELQHEPKIALTDKKTGTELYQELFKQLQERPQKPYFVLLEVNPVHAQYLAQLADDYLDIKYVQIIKDLSGKDRVLKIELI